MTTREYLAESAKLCEKMGTWPEWESEGARYRIYCFYGCWHQENWEARHKQEWHARLTRMYSFHEAACIFERHWRVWLAVQGCYLVPTVTNGGVTDNYVVYDINDAVIACVESYYAAQIAAVKAVLGATREARSGQERSNTWFCEYCDRELEDDADVVLYGDIACCSRECAEGLAARFDSGRTAIPKKRDA